MLDRPRAQARQGFSFAIEEASHDSQIDFGGRATNTPLANKSGCYLLQDSALIIETSPPGFLHHRKMTNPTTAQGIFMNCPYDINLILHILGNSFGILYPISLYLGWYGT